MAETKYSYDIAADLPGGQVNVGQLQTEIQASGISMALSRIESADGTLSYSVMTGGTLDVYFKDALSAGDKTLLDGDTTGPAGGLLSLHVAQPTKTVQAVSLDSVKVDADGSLVTASIVPAGSETIKITHNYCDKTTWFTNAESVVDAAASESTPTTFQLPDTDIIDISHGKVYDEDSMSATYPLVVKVDGTPMVEDEYDGAVNDFSLDYKTGLITFAASQTGKTVTASYHKATDSVFKIIPLAGKKLQIEKAEVQFSADFDMNDTFQFQVYMPGVGVVASTNYKSMTAIIQEAYGVFPEMPAMGGAQRGTTQVYYNLPFHYTRKREIPEGLEVWVRLKDDKVCGGEHASVTFHCAVADA